MYKLGYCWKCEEIKEQHKKLNKLLPDTVCELLNDYNKCETCEEVIDQNEKYEKHKLKNKNKDNEYYKHEKILKRVSRQLIFSRMSIKDYKFMIKRANIKPDTKQMLLDYVRHYYPNKSNIYWESNIKMIHQYAIWVRHPGNFKYKIMGRNQDLIKEIIILLIDKVLTSRQVKCNITIEEIREYIDHITTI